jgi:hypothetical protein
MALWYKGRHLEKKRERRLHRLAQKRGVTDQLTKIEQTAHSWNRRRGLVNSLRFQSQS